MNRKLRILLALSLALFVSWGLVEVFFYPDRPRLRSDPLFRVKLLWQQYRARQEQASNLPPPWTFQPLPNYPTLPSQVVTQPSRPTPYPTFNQERMITRTPQQRSGKVAEPTPTSLPTQPPAPAPSVLATELLVLINRERQRKGASTLVFNRALNQAAQTHADTTTGCTHYGPDGSSPFERVRAAGYPSSGVGENIACGVRTPAEVLRLWQGSPGHYSNLVNPQWRSVGIGIARGYWVFVAGPL